jgi:hypothetical protein
MAKNPVLEKVRQEAYNKGFKKGVEMGQDNACLIFASKFEGLQEVPGIGPKLMEKIVNHFGREYFEVVEVEKTR